MLINIDGGQKSEVYFQSMLGGVFNFLFLNEYPNVKYIVNLEVTNSIQKRLDSIFIPIKDKSQTIII